MQAQPKTRILIELFGPYFRVVSDLSFHHAPIAGSLAGRGSGIDN